MKIPTCTFDDQYFNKLTQNCECRKGFIFTGSSCYNTACSETSFFSSAEEKCVCYDQYEYFNEYSQTCKAIEGADLECHYPYYL